MTEVGLKLYRKPLQLPLIIPDSDWKPPKLSELPSWKGVKRVALDSETNDRHLLELGIGVRRGAYMVGVSVAIEDGPSFYLPWAHGEGGMDDDNLPKEACLQYLRDNAKTFEGEIVGANLAYDLDFMFEEGIEFPLIKFFRDIQIADPLIFELHRSYTLDNIAQRYGLPGKDESKLREAAAAYGVDPKSGLWQLPARFVGAYAEADAVQPLLTLRRQEREIDDKDLWDIYNLESEVIPVLVRMRRRGVRIDQDKLQEIEDWTLEEEAKALRIVRNATTVDIKVGDCWKPKPLIAALEYIGLTLPVTATGKKSVAQDVFATLDHPVTNALAWARKVNKLRTTFAESIRSHMTNGRIHCNFNQILHASEGGGQKGVRYGRLSATNPNLQQQPNPKKDPRLGGEWRKIFIPEEGAKWCIADYSQQEPRWTTHFSTLAKLPGAAEAAQAYHDNPDLDNHKFMAELIGIDRDPAKAIYLGLCYGEGGAKMCDDLGLPTRWAIASGTRYERTIEYFETEDECFKRHSEIPSAFMWRAAGKEGQTILDKFDERAPFIRKVAKMASQQAAKNGYITTGGGRRLHFLPDKSQPGKVYGGHKALNRVIQGTSADQMKKALVALDRERFWIMLQVHDESDNSIAERKEADRIAEIMRDIMPAKVPFKVDIEIGPSWGEAK